MELMGTSNFKKKLCKLMTVLMVFSLFVNVNVSTKAADLNEEADLEEVITIIDDTEKGTGMNQFNFSNGWIADAGNSNHNKTEHWTNKGRWVNGEAPSFEMKFTGNKIEIYGKKDLDLGIYSVSIDGGEAVEVDAYNLTAQHQEKLYESPTLDNGEHTLKFQILDKRNAMSDESRLLGAQIDFAKVYSMEVVNPDKEYMTIANDHSIGEGLFEYQFSNGWNESTGINGFYNGDEFWTRASSTFEPSFTLKFYGSKIELYGVKEASSAIYEISIDGEEAEDIDAYNPTRVVATKFYEKDGLSEGEHTLTLKVTNRKNPSSSSYTGEMDYAKVYHKAIPATGVIMNQDSIQIEKGMTETISATVVPSYSTQNNIIYSVENEEIATVNESGEITAIKEGKTKVVATVKDTEIIDKMELTVTPSGLLLGAAVGSTDFHYLQKNYNDIRNLNKNTWSDTAWIGDELNSKIVTWTKGSDVHNVTMNSSNFTTASGNIIDSSNIEISWLKETLANIGRGNSSAPVESFPDIIHQSGAMDISAKKVASAWININIPRDAKAGIYNGTITVSADELETPYVFDYSFEVLNIVQPMPKDTNTQIEIWQHPYSVARYYGVTQDELFTEKHFNYLKSGMEEYRDMGGRGVIANIVEEAWNHQSYDSDPSMVKWTKKLDGSFEFNYDHFDKWIQFNVDLGVINPEDGLGQIKCYSIVPWNNRIQYYNESTGRNESISPRPGSAEWKAPWTVFLTDFMNHVEEKGWFDVTYIAMDERGMDDLRASVDLIESITNAEGESFKISSAMNYQSGNDYSFLDRIDDISIGLSHINNNSNDMKNMSEHRKELGLLTTIYTCTGDYPNSFTISDTSESAWTIWYSLAQNTDGFMRWSWDGWVENPLENVSYKYWEPGDPFYIYPAEKDNTERTFYSTPKYERLKEGIRDINKAKYIMENSTELADGVDALVKSLKRPNKGGNGYGSAVAASEADRELTNSEVQRMRNGINEFAKQYIESNSNNITGVELNKNEINMNEGQVDTLIATVKPEDATNKNVIWSSEDEIIAKVVDGKVTALKEGVTTITVTTEDGNYTASCIVTVKKEDTENIKVSKPVKFKSENITSSSVTLSWKEPSSSYGLVSYVIYKDGKAIDTVDKDIINYTVDGLKSNTIYGFKVSAKYSNDEVSKPVSLTIRTKKK